MTREIAFTAVVRSEGGYGVAIVERDVAGYALDPSEPVFETWEAASKRADERNKAASISARGAWGIVASSMSQSVHDNKRWSPRGS